MNMVAYNEDCVPGPEQEIIFFDPTCMCCRCYEIPPKAIIFKIPLVQDGKLGMINLILCVGCLAGLNETADALENGEEGRKLY